MNEMNSYSKRGKSRTGKLIALACITILVLGGIYSVAAYNNRLWPFTETTQQTTTPTSIIGTDTDTLVDAEPVDTKPTATMKEPTIDKTVEVETLRVKAHVKTKDQGDCTLTLSNDKNTYTLTSSTIGVHGKTGCLEWNIGTKSIPKGTYRINVLFVGPNGEVSTSDEITIS